jgi:hypothetical protein
VFQGVPTDYQVKTFVRHPFILSALDSSNSTPACFTSGYNPIHNIQATTLFMPSSLKTFQNKSGPPGPISIMDSGLDLTLLKIKLILPSQFFHTCTL